MWIRVDVDAFEACIQKLKPSQRLAGHRMLWHFLTRARWEDGIFGGLELSKGQLVVDTRSTPSEIGLSRQTFRTLLKSFSNQHTLFTQTNPQGTVITILEYDSLRMDLKKTNPPTENELTHNQPTTNPQLTHNTCTTQISTIENKTLNNPYGLLSAGALDHQKAMALLDEISQEIGFFNGGGKPPFSFFGRLMKHYGIEATISIFRKFSASGKTVADIRAKRPDTDPQAYFAAAVANEQARIQAGAAPAKTGFDLAVEMGLCDEKGNPL